VNPTDNEQEVFPAVGTDSSADRAQRVRAIYQLVDDNDIDAAIALFADDAEYHRPGQDPLLGAAAIGAFYRSGPPFTKAEHVLSPVLVTGDEAAVRGVFHATLPDGTEIEVRFADFFTFDADNRFTYRESYFFAPPG
jgi:ketosteroid isomerase-like protein